MLSSLNLLFGHSTGSNDGDFLGFQQWSDDKNQRFVLEPAGDSNTSASLTMQSSAEYSTANGYNGSYLTKVVDGRGKETNNTYNDLNGLLTSSKTAGETDAVKSNYTYDTNNVLTQVSKKANDTANASTNTYAYDGNYQLTGITHNTSTATYTNVKYTFGYDDFGQVTSVGVGNGLGNSSNLITNQYGPKNGDLQLSTYGNGSTVGYTYDIYGRLSEKKFNNTVVSKYDYDKNGNIGREYDYINNWNTLYTYDFLNRPVKSTRSDGFSTGVVYDSNGKVSQSLVTVNNTTAKTEYIYGQRQDWNEIPTNVYGINLNGTRKLTYTEDSLTRRETRTISTTTPFVTQYSYVNGANNTTTALLASQNNGGNTLSYTYDDKGNIATISENGVEKERYTYDALNQLVRNDSVTQNKSIVYTYDLGGNMMSKKYYTYTTGTLTGTYNNTQWGYSNYSWMDKVSSMSYNGSITASFTYDAIGNPLTYRDGLAFTWQNGRQLATINRTGLSATYQYDDGGIRTKKTVNGTITNYYMDGSNIASQITGANRMDLYYDEAGNAYGMNYNGTSYYYIRNAQNDIIGMLDSAGVKVVSYQYDAWGKLLSVKDGAGADKTSDASFIGNINPLRYRGYYYDTESGLYYLQSRYYDPNTCRFINADKLVSTGQAILGHNMYAYCGNNPIIYVDSNGDFAMLIGALIGAGFGFAFSVGYQMLVENKTFDEINWVDVGASALSGALAGTGVGIVGSIVGNSAINTGAYMINQKLNGQEITNEGILWSAGTGAISGAIGGKGNNLAELSGIRTTSKQLFLKIVCQ